MVGRAYVIKNERDFGPQRAPKYMCDTLNIIAPRTAPGFRVPVPSEYQAEFLYTMAKVTQSAPRLHTVIILRSETLSGDEPRPGCGEQPARQIRSTLS